ncbi:hypothetical protein J2X14_003429 [Pantoea alhagi]|uniref:DUF3304 domain-containing protein n=1 Tax=Mixta sp. BE291 TaxID=3158787 RepID=UPI00285DCEB3|nr:hypothetical protein [Pantoea alhagi]
MRKRIFTILVILMMSGCSQAGSSDYTAGDIRGINHTANVINYVKVNGRGGPNISAYGEGGGYCCVMLPLKWTPGLKARIEWEVDPDTASPFPGYQDREKYKKWEKEVKASYQKHSAIVDIPEYGKSRCGITVHFLPCNQVKVTTVCEGYGTPDYPIKEPLNMKEPAQCPQ